MVEILVSGIIGYLIGSIPPGVIVTRLLGRPDVRHSGSGHTGGLNVSRQAGVWAGVLTAVSDGLKGAVAVGAALLLFHDAWAATSAGVLAVAGHDWSIFLHFAGGIGLMTMAGAQLCATPLEGLWTLLILGPFLAVLIFVIRFHRARSTIVAVALVGPVMWAVGAGLPGIVQGSAAALVVIIKTLPDWSRVYE